jgi:Holliday junction resolvasome RuvABC endonuclease subunit
VEWDCWRTPASRRPELRLKTIFDGVQELIAEFAPDAVVLEESFVGVDARTALSVGQARVPSWSRPPTPGSSALNTRPRA